MSFGEKYASMLGGKFLRVKNEAPIEACLRGEERIANCVYVEGVGSKESTSEDARPQMAVNAYLPNQRRMAILNGPITLARALYDANISPDDVIRISRSGSGKSTRFAVEKLRKLTAEENAHADATPLWDLADLWSGKPRDAGTAKRFDVSDDSDEMPF